MVRVSCYAFVRTYGVPELKKSQGVRALLGQLEKLRRLHDDANTAKKVTLLNQLGRLRFGRAAELYKFHDILVYLRAYPDSPELLLIIEKLLETFSARPDTRKFSNELASSGISGCPIDYRFFFHMSLWLAQNFTGKLCIDWGELEDEGQLLALVPLLGSFSESAQFDDFEFSAREWLSRLKHPVEGDGEFLVKRIAAIYGNDQEREATHDKLDVPFRLLAGKNCPSISNACYPVKSIVYMRDTVDQGRPRLEQLMQSAFFSARKMNATESRKLVNLARTVMVTHERDMDVFSKASEKDVRLVDCGDGLQLVMMGMQPTQRYLLPAIYGFLMLRNGVPIGYYQASVLFETADLALNIFSTFRGGDAAQVIARAVAVTHHLFGCTTFMLDGYQLGYNNRDSIESGVWWFYYKLGFRPRDSAAKKIMRTELAKMKRRPGYRSSVATLEKLSEYNMYYVKERSAKEIDLSLYWNIAPGLSDYISRRFGADRESGSRTCTKEAAQRLGLRKLPKMSAPERYCWNGWAPLVLQLKGVERWSTDNRRRLARIMRAKGADSEINYSKLMLEHKVLQRAILRYAESIDP